MKREFLLILALLLALNLAACGGNAGRAPGEVFDKSNFKNVKDLYDSSEPNLFNF